VDWTTEASRLLRRRPPALGTSVCTCSTPTPSKAEAADWRRRRKSPTRPSSTGEGWDRVYYVPARPRPLGEHGGEPHGLRFTRLLRPSRTAAVSQWSMSTGTAAPDRGIDYGTRQLGDHEPYPSHGSGSPGGVYRGRRGRLEVTLRSYSCVQEYARERVNSTELILLSIVLFVILFLTLKRLYLSQRTVTDARPCRGPLGAPLDTRFSTLPAHAGRSSESCLGAMVTLPFSPGTAGQNMRRTGRRRTSRFTRVVERTHRAAS
jgi:hypothetical protein